MSFSKLSMTATKRVMNAEAVANGATSYTSSFEMVVWAGFISVEVVLAAASSVTITQQCSNDNSTWYDPVDADGNAIGKVCTALTASKFIEPDPVLAKWVRYKVVAGADSTVTMKVNVKE